MCADKGGSRLRRDRDTQMRKVAAQRAGDLRTSISLEPGEKAESVSCHSF